MKLLNFKMKLLNFHCKFWIFHIIATVDISRNYCHRQYVTITMIGRGEYNGKDRKFLNLILVKQILLRHDYQMGFFISSLSMLENISSYSNGKK